jgi:uncharacterized protein (UPF0548 family)
VLCSLQMLLLKKPSDSYINEFVAKQSSLDVTYAQVLSTKNGAVPPGYGSDHVTVILGSGAQCFSLASQAVRNWHEFKVGWVQVYPKDVLLKPGNTVAVLAQFLGLWSLNACRILYVIDEETRFGFGYGTLPVHEEIGEERFLIEWDRSSDAVSYDILAFSNPSRWWWWLFFPIHRIAQDKFRRDSLSALKKRITST